MRRAADAENPKIYLLPNLMTAGNLLCGFVAVLKIVEGALLQSADPTQAAQRFELRDPVHPGGVHLRCARWAAGAAGRARERVSGGSSIRWRISSPSASRRR